MSLHAVSRPIPVDKTGVVRAVKATQKTDGTLAYLDLMRAVVPEGVREALIIMLPNDEEGGLKFNSKVINLSKFKKGVFPVQFLYEIPKKPEAGRKLMTPSKLAIYDSRREIGLFFFNKEIENVDFRGIPFTTPTPH